MAKREKVEGIQTNSHVAMRLGNRRVLNKGRPMGAQLDQLDHVKASRRSKVEHPFRVIKQNFCHLKGKGTN